MELNPERMDDPPTEDEQVREWWERLVDLLILTHLIHKDEEYMLELIRDNYELTRKEE